MTLRVLIADDEPPARRRLGRLLARHDDVEVVGEARNGDETITLVNRLHPDLLLLDIRMPGTDGLTALGRIERPPVVILVTAHREHAVDAFDLDVLDYLLKPYSDSRFDTALERARQRIRERHAHGLVRHLGGAGADETTAEATRDTTFTDRLAVPSGSRTVFVDTAAIEWIGAEGVYVRLHTVESTSHLLRDTLKSLESRLDPDRFLRIHRSTIVRIDRIVEMTPLAHGEYELTLLSGARVKLSRSFRHQLERIRPRL
ncbi:MAG: LytTR family DNA-binding domain-containing protein [Acidobacteriota bacterium]